MYHNIVIVGNLGRDPEMRYTPSGTAVTNFSVAVKDDYTDNSGEKVKRTLWFRVAAWGKRGEVCNQYLQKGSKVLVEGKLVCDPETGGPKTYTKQDGSAGTSFEIRAANVTFLSSKGESQRDNDDYNGEHTSSQAEEDSIPF